MIMPETRITLADGMVSAANLIKWAAQDLDVSISYRQARLLFREFPKWYAEMGEDWERCVKQGDWHNANRIRNVLRLDLVRFDNGKHVIPRPTPKANRVYFCLDEYDRVWMKVAATGVLVGGKELSPYGEFACRVREEMISQFDCNEVFTWD